MSAAVAKQNAIEGQRQGWSGGNSGQVVWSNQNAFSQPKSKNSANPRKWFMENSAEAVHKVENDLREAFNRVDLDNSNSIEMDEFVSAMKFLGADMDIHQMERLFGQLDVDGSGDIDFEEFRAGYDKIDVMKAFIERSLKSAGLSTRKAGPREIGRSQKLASELAGIRPMTATQAAAEADPNFTRPKITQSSLKGFSGGSKRRSNSRTIRHGRAGSRGRQEQRAGQPRGQIIGRSNGYSNGHSNGRGVYGNLT